MEALTVKAHQNKSFHKTGEILTYLMRCKQCTGIFQMGSFCMSMQRTTKPYWASQPAWTQDSFLDCSLVKTIIHIYMYIYIQVMYIVHMTIQEGIRVKYKY